ncbi:MAG: metalloregulator ArsR/SmtB family transcription factor [Bacteroidetes bacterium]|nr:metalloregulator ArsR/SmtB family transcription factor [Bacteroidota bacterium]
MLTEPQLADLVQFFKVLGEPQRLKIVGLLSQRPHTVEDLARSLRLSVSTVSHHLSRLTDAGLVNARAESYYNVYMLKTDALTAMARTILKQAEQPRHTDGAALDAFAKKVLDAFTTADGRIKSFPVQEKKYLVLIRYVLKAFDPGVKYTEKRVNQILANYNEDTARLRRSLVEYRFMAREGGGGKYWRIDEEKG